MRGWMLAFFLRRQDGLFTTVVVDECGVALGLVYSSAESIRVSHPPSFTA
jgi:hypothetical protein